MAEYTAVCFDGQANESAVSGADIACFQWEGEEPFRPKSRFWLHLVKNKGIYVKMLTDETQLRVTCSRTDEPCYEDSCLEAFIKPFDDDERYINIEVNPAGAYLCQIGAGRHDRVFVKSLCSVSPAVCCEVLENGWQARIFIPDELITALFSRRFDYASPFTANFYKCGDLTARPHYGSFAPMGSLPPGFHDPGKFAKIIIKDA